VAAALSEAAHQQAELMAAKEALRDAKEKTEEDRLAMGANHALVEGELRESLRVSELELVQTRRQQEETVAGLRGQLQFAAGQAAAGQGDSNPILSFERMTTDPHMMSKVRELTGWTSVSSFKCAWELLNHVTYAMT
jgi:hypothetical protein